MKERTLLLGCLYAVAVYEEHSIWSHIEVEILVIKTSYGCASSILDYFFLFFVFLPMYMCAYVCVYMHVCKHVYMCGHMFVHMCVRQEDDIGCLPGTLSTYIEVGSLT